MGRGALHLLLVRHGKTDWNEQGRLMGRNEVGLSPRGRAQATALAEALAATSLSRVVASPQPRAQETARAIAAKHALAVAAEPDLAEVWLDPAWQGKTFDDLRDEPHLKRYTEDSTYRSEMIEAAEVVRDRVAAAVERLRADAAGERVLLVSHGDPIRILIAHLLGMALADYRSLTIETGSLSVLRLGSRAHLALLNWQPDGPAALLDRI